MNNQVKPSKENKKRLNDRFSVILVEPSKTQNVGSIARVMMNFGFHNLVLINPKVNLADPEIEIIARKAIQIVNQAQIVTRGLKYLRDEFGYFIGTTARVGSDYNLNRIAISPENAFENYFQHDRIGIVFGREQHGLLNEEISLCDMLLNIPADKDYPVLNLSHALTIILYELKKNLKIQILQEPSKHPKHRVATFKEREKLKSYFNLLIKKINYHPEKQHVATMAFSNILSRGYITGREVTTLMGVFKWFDYQLNE
jgi:TrmH family RNA methyltransferase